MILYREIFLKDGDLEFVVRVVKDEEYKGADLFQIENFGKRSYVYTPEKNLSEVLRFLRN